MLMLDAQLPEIGLLFVKNIYHRQIHAENTRSYILHIFDSIN